MAEFTDTLIEQRALQYRALRLPVMLDKQGELLRALGVAGLFIASRSVIPAKAGIHDMASLLDSRLRGNDGST